MNDENEYEFDCDTFRWQLISNTSRVRVNIWLINFDYNWLQQMPKIHTPEFLK